MHTLLAGESSNPTLGNTYLILYQLNLASFSYHQFDRFWLKFLSKNHEFVNFEFNIWICNSILG
jgi:hypothetical protein